MYLLQASPTEQSCCITLPPGAERSPISHCLQFNQQLCFFYVPVQVLCVSNMMLHLLLAGLQQMNAEADLLLASC